MNYTEFKAGLEQVANTRNLVNVTNFLVEAQKSSLTLTYSIAEKCLRELRSDVFLVARPSDTCPAELTVQNAVTKELEPFYLWVGVNGKAEADGILFWDRHTDAQNLINLSHCGLLTIPEQP